MSERSRRLKRPIVLLIALIIGVAAVVFTFTYLDKNMAMVKDMDKDSMEAAGKSLGISIGVALATPHMIVAAVATAACGLAWLLKAALGGYPGRRAVCHCPGADVALVLPGDCADDPVLYRRRQPGKTKTGTPD